jgi:cell division protein FtsL
LNRIEGITRIYSQAPWRKQSQIAGLILVVVVFSTLFATVYLHISARTAEVGRQIQVMQNEIDELDRMNEDLRSQLALIKSSDQMEQRAEALGLQSRWMKLHSYRYRVIWNLQSWFINIKPWMRLLAEQSCQMNIPNPYLTGCKGKPRFTWR